MRLYGAISKVEPQSDGTIKVEGIASSEAVDDQQEVVRADAMRDAIPDYMKFPALREMHQLSAAGTTLEADVGDDGMTRIFAHVVDPIAVAKVKNLVYRGFSIGGQVTARDTANRKIITGIKLNEISLVDRPANPEAILDCWKAGGAIIEGNIEMPDGGLATIGEMLAVKAEAPITEPTQIWACGNTEHRHVGKAEAVKCLEDETAKATSNPAEGAGAPEGDPAPDAAAEVDPAAVAEPPEAQAALEMARAAIERGEAVLARAGATTEAGEAEVDPQSVDQADAAEKGGDAPGDGAKPYGDVEYADSGHQADGKKRYPIDTAEHIRAAWSYINKPKNAGKYSAEDLKAIKAKIVSAWKDKIDSDGPPSASEKAAIDLVDLLNALVAFPDDAKTSFIASLQKTIIDATPLETLVSSDIEKGARHGATDQVHLDNAAYCCSKAMGVRSASKTEKMSIADAHKAVLDAGATAIAAPASHSPPTNATQDTADKAALDSGATSIAAPASQAPPRNATQDTGRNAESAAPQSSAGKVPTSPMPKASDQQLLEDATQKIGESIAIVSKAGGSQSEIIEILAAAENMTKAGVPPHHILMDMAHKCLKAFSSGSTCKADMPDPERHGVEDMIRVHSAHYHIGKVGGGACMPGGEPTRAGEGEGQGASSSFKAAEAAVAEAAAPDALAKALADKTAQVDELVKTLNAVVPMLTKMEERLEKTQERVEQIAATPIPPMAMVRGGIPTTKAADNAPTGSGSQPTQADIVTALADMSEQDQTLTLIKVAQRKPMAVPLSVVSPSQMRERAQAR